uniref:DUF86 domain-containing protein n=1 Tax=candidate division WOR-3 bacterium TaxID=2052148 RepID=A0A7C4YR00_UNCW3
MSKKERDWKLFIMEIMESINKIENYIEGLNYEQFVRDEKTKDAVVRNLEIIGEAANQIPKEIQQKFSNVPWAQIIAMRNRMIHGYFAIDYRIVWDIVKIDIPSLKKELELILQKGVEE